MNHVESSLSLLPSPSLPVTITIQRTPFAQRRRWPAWILSCAAHILLLILVLWGFERVIEEPPPTIRLVFVEPPPPPPAPLGAPAATGTTPIPEQPPAVVEKPQQEKPKEPIKLQQQEPDRLKIAKKNKKPEPVSPATPNPGPDMATKGTAEPQPGIAYNWRFNNPYFFAFPYTNAELASNSDSADPESIFAGGKKGNKVPYIPEFTFTIGTAVEFERFGFAITGIFYDSTYTSASNTTQQINAAGRPDARFGKTDSYFIGDLSAYYQWNKTVKVLGGIQNFSDAS